MHCASDGDVDLFIYNVQGVVYLGLFFQSFGVISIYFFFSNCSNMFYMFYGDFLKSVDILKINKCKNAKVIDMGVG